MQKNVFGHILHDEVIIVRGIFVIVAIFEKCCKYLVAPRIHIKES